MIQVIDGSWSPWVHSRIRSKDPGSFLSVKWVWWLPFCNCCSASLSLFSPIEVSAINKYAGINSRLFVPNISATKTEKNDYFDWYNGIRYAPKYCFAATRAAAYFPSCNNINPIETVISRSFDWRSLSRAKLILSTVVEVRNALDGPFEIFYTSS